MNVTKPIPRRILWVIVALIGALFACTASLTDDGGGDTGGSGSGGGVDSGIAPVVRILEPVSGTTVAANQRLDITVATDTTATSFLLNVSGRVASTRSLPPDQSGPSQAILSWTPDRQGTFSLEIIAYNGTAASAPASLMVQVSGTASTTLPGQTVTGTCTGRVLVSQLNFRDGPSTNNTKLGQFDVGETVTVIGRSGDAGWYKVQRLNAQQVWTINNAQWFQTEGNCSAVPVVS